MAKSVVCTDDISGIPGAKPHKFSIDDDRYQIDLSDQNYDALHKALEPFIAHATPARINRSANEQQAIRDWAREQGLKIGSKGRISEHIMQAYKEREQ